LLLAEVDALTAALRTHRDRAMVAAMVLGGLRFCEVLGLRLGDLRAAERRVFIADGKGGRQRLIRPGIMLPPGGRSARSASARPASGCDLQQIPLILEATPGLGIPQSTAPR
jgi:hypothetical protein